jgi:hypothetical protein
MPPTQGIRVFALDLQTICAEYRIEESDEISVLELDMHHIGPQYVFRTWFPPTENIRVIAFDLQPICAEHEPEKWLALYDETRVYGLDIWV